MSFYRNIVWFIKGLKEYTRGGYVKASKNFDPSDLEDDLFNKSYMVTGANSGLGMFTAMTLVRMGGIVHMVCRDPARGEEARKEIIAEIGNECLMDNLILHILDLSIPADIVKFVKSFENSEQKLDVLINNAGCMVHTREVTEDKLEKNFATNTLGTHLLTTLLIPTLLKAKKPRVITVSSGGMLVEKLNIDDLQFEKVTDFDGTMAYAQTKRQQVVLTEHYAKKYPDIHFSCMHPGWADTPAVRTSMPYFYEKMKNKLRTTEEGADTIIWLAASSAAYHQPSGLFFQDRVSVPKHLPMAWTKSSQEEEEVFMEKLNEIARKFTSK
ncbi:hypothetical protein CHS0354_034967 [Potamilus streckersoni]|uniref:Dehydrogenase/reductase SDR family member 12 n=1 Tax=Potamilus streckersoni TaxID=2493646 RepID=A0AAE0SER5_9BIVA|nr:hypothetical protein CHS0354_034967 [Potamilus streckersoni]